jgi:cell division protein ZapE
MAGEKVASTLLREVERALGRLRVDVRGTGLKGGFKKWAKKVTPAAQQRAAIEALEAAYAARPAHAEKVADWGRHTKLLQAAHEVRCVQAQREAEKKRSSFLTKKETPISPLTTPLVGPCSWLQAGPRPKLEPAGVYLHGCAGSGKTTVADIAFLAAPGEKRRLHFHELAVEVHQLLAEGVPMPRVADKVLAGAQMLIIDELNVTAIGDALLISSLLDRCQELDVTLVMTTNRAPENLYAHGLNRRAVLKLLAPVLSRMTPVAIDGVDYRAQEFEDSDSSDRFSSAPWEELFLAESGGLTPSEEQVPLQWNRKMRLATGGGVAHATFEDLCVKAMSAEDFLVLGDRFHTVVVSQVKPLAGHQHNEARRLTNLIDALYEANVKLVIGTSTECTIDDLLTDVAKLSEQDQVGTGILSGFDASLCGASHVLTMEDVRAARRHGQKDSWDRYDSVLQRTKEAQSKREIGMTRSMATMATTVFQPQLDEYEEAMTMGLQVWGKPRLAACRRAASPRCEPSRG